MLRMISSLAAKDDIILTVQLYLTTANFFKIDFQKSIFFLNVVVLAWLIFFFLAIFLKMAISQGNKRFFQFLIDSTWKFFLGVHFFRLCHSVTCSKVGLDFFFFVFCLFFFLLF